MDEQELLKCLCTDESRGIRIAMDQYGGAVKSICYSILSGYSREDMEEAISDAFLGLWKSRERIRLEEGMSIRSYLYGIARKSALDRKRQLAKKKPTEDIEEMEFTADVDVEQEAIKKVEYQLVYQLILDMKHPDQQIFIYRYFKQLSVKEIAKVLDLTPKSVENKLSRGKVKMREQLKKFGIYDREMLA